MTVRVRVIPCLDVADGRVVKGVNFVDLRDAGDPVEAARAYDGRIQELLQDIVQQGRQSGDFERKTPLDEAVMAIHLVMRPYLNPLLLQHGLDYTDEAPLLLSSLILRSLSP